MTATSSGSYILLVEDDVRDVEMTIRALRRHGIMDEIHVARDGAEALAVLFGDEEARKPAAPPPRFVLLDLKLPKVSGIEVLRRIKGDPALRVLPVVAFTSSREGPDVRACYQLGINSYLVKPLDYGEFSEVLRQAGVYWNALNEPPSGGGGR